jgi:hypothetical protein
MKLSKKILCYPLQNDKNINAIFRSFRNEINFLMSENNKLFEKMRNNKTDLNTINNHELLMKQKSDKFQKEILDNNLQNPNPYGDLNLNPFPYSLNNDGKGITGGLSVKNCIEGSLTNDNLLENKIKIQNKEIEKLRYELKLAEEEKMKILNNFKKTNNNNSKRNRNNNININPEDIEDDIKDQMEIMSALNKLQEKLNIMDIQKKELEEENLNLTSALNNQIFEIEKIKGKNFNLVNNLNSEISSLRDLLNSNKAEIEMIRNSKANVVKIKENIVKDSNEKDKFFDEKINEIQQEAEQRIFKNTENQMKNFDRERRDLKLKSDNLIDEVKELKTLNQELIDKNNKLEFMFKEIKNNFIELMKKYDKETEKFNLTDIENDNENSVDNKNNGKNVNNNASNNINNINNINNNTNSNAKSSIKPIKPVSVYKPYNAAVVVPKDENKPKPEDQLRKIIFEQRTHFFEKLQINEKDLEKNLNLEKSKNKSLIEKIKNLRLLCRKLKNLALDYYPYKLQDLYNSNLNSNTEKEKEKENENEGTKFIKNLLTEENLDDLLIINEETSLTKFYEYEIIQLRERVKKLEEEKMYITNNKINNNNNKRSNSNFNFEENFANLNSESNKKTYRKNENLNETHQSENGINKEIQIKILNEIEKLKGKSKNFYKVNTSVYEKENEKLKFEIKTLKNDLFKLKRNLTERIENVNIDLNNVSNGAYGNNKLNINRDEFKNKNQNHELEKVIMKLQVKNEYLNDSVIKLERENVDLKVRVNVAEEQLFNLQEFMRSGKNRY